MEAVTLATASQAELSEGIEVTDPSSSGETRGCLRRALSVHCILFFMKLREFVYGLSTTANGVVAQICLTAEVGVRFMASCTLK